MTRENGNNTEFKMTTAKFQGYVTRALEDNDTSHEEIKDTMKDIGEKIDKVHSRITRVQVKVAIFGGAAGLIVSLVFFLLKLAINGGK